MKTHNTPRQSIVPQTSIVAVIDYTQSFASPQGALSVAGGDSIGKTIQDIVEAFAAKGIPAVFTGDAHPHNHISFASRFGISAFSSQDGEIKRPDHSIEGTVGAQLYSPFDTSAYTREIKKGYKENEDSYSAFGGVTEDEQHTFDEYLQSKGITDIYLAGLATDYCVGETALDARKASTAANPDKVQQTYNVHIITDAVKGVTEETTRVMEQKLHAAGVHFLSSHELLQALSSSQASKDTIEAK